MRARLGRWLRGEQGVTLAPGVVLHAGSRSAVVDGVEAEGAAAFVALAPRVADPTQLAEAALVLLDAPDTSLWLTPRGGAWPPEAEAQAAPPVRTDTSLVYWRTAGKNVADLVRCVASLRDGSLTCTSSADLRPVEEQLGSDNVYVRLRGVRRLGETSDVSRLVSLRDDDPRVREGVAAALGPLAGSEALARLAELLQDEAPSVRLAAARALGTRAGPEARALLEGALRDADPRVKLAAEKLLGG